MAPSVIANSDHPISVKDLITEAEDFDFYVEQPLSTWLRSAKVLLTQASSCEQQGDLKLAFLYTYRHVVLILNKVKQYPESQRNRFEAQLKQEQKRVVVNLKKLEKWKPILTATYERELRALESHRSAVNRHRTGSNNDRAPFLPASDVDVAQRDMLDTTSQTRPDAGFAPYGSQYTQIIPQRRAQWSDVPDYDEDTFTKLQQTRELIAHDTTNRSKHLEPKHREAFAYPAVVKRDSSSDWPSSPPEVQRLQALPPRVPSKYTTADAPERPVKAPIESPQAKHKATSFTEGGQALRTVFLPSNLQQAFLNLADANTGRDLETCGILGASLVSNALIITHLIIPDQTSTSDTCDTTETGDVTLYDYCEANNLISCGWIHTHPSQTCFLSSRDLHTSAAYQQMLPEALAIVCAPRHNPRIGIFRLTSPPGLPAILRCQLPGLFHQHEERNLYTDATSPGHVVEDTELDFRVVDLRSS